ncbi:MAG TPA: sigma-70 family RNA polymerase sigma factor [Phycisphaerae bacterium]|nr:sigma-70 family RNA polymerase sigma factor [Phycisphaerae bacterium]
MTTVQIPNMQVSDADLVIGCRKGNREAFGQIVRRYQGMVSGLIYADCGDLERSEEVAQETFISAWRSLGELREPAKLAGWLCRIARNRLVDQTRNSARQEALIDLVSENQRDAVAAPPEQGMLSAEEKELLWRTLSAVPQPYRETLVLYYRQGKSAAEVAAATQTTEMVVRQRLARGRQMLREQVNAMVERQILRSAPGPAFTAAVVGALPAAMAPTAVGFGAAAKGSAVAKGGGWLFLLTAWMVPIMALLTMVAGTWQSIRTAKTPRLRRLFAAWWIMVWLLVLGWIVAINVLINLGQHQHWSYQAFVTMISGMICFYGMAVTGLAAWLKLSARTTWIREGLPNNPELAKLPKMGFWTRLLFFAGPTAAALSWMIEMGLRAGDHLSAGIVAAIIGILCLWSALQKHDHGKWPDPVKSMAKFLSVMVVVMLVMLNWKLRSWVAVHDGVSISQVQGELPLWPINLFAVVLFIWMVGLIKLTKRPMPKVLDSE